MGDEDWDWDQIVDLDVTGDLWLDQFGYHSPRRPRPRPGFKAGPDRDWLAHIKRDRQQRERRREAQQRQREEARRQRELSPSHRIVPFEPGPAYQPEIGPVRWQPPVNAEPVPQPASVEPESNLRPYGAKLPQPGQHGAYFEVRTKRAPWLTRKVWQQISTWQVGQPPAGATVVTVADVAQLPGQVHTIGRVSGTGAVEY